MPLIATLGGSRRLGRLAGAYSLMLLGCVLIVPAADAREDDIFRRSLGGSFLILLGMLVHPGSLDEPGMPAPLQRSLVGGMFHDLYEPSPNLLWSLRFAAGGGAVAFWLRRYAGPFFLLRYFAGGLGLLPAQAHRAWARSRTPAPFGMRLQRADLPPHLVNFLCGLLLESAALTVQASLGWVLSRQVGAVQNLPPRLLMPTPHWSSLARQLAPAIVSSVADHGARLVFMIGEPNDVTDHPNAGNMAWLLSRFTTRFFLGDPVQGQLEAVFMLLFDMLQLTMRDHRLHGLRDDQPAYPAGFTTLPLSWQRQVPGRAAAQLAMQVRGYFPRQVELPVWPSPSASPVMVGFGPSPAASSRSASPPPGMEVALTPILVAVLYDLPNPALMTPVHLSRPHSRSPSRGSDAEGDDAKSESRRLLPPR